ncbi:MAG TPA: hypothetical protein VLV18_10695, partial [Terriglobales bacterium]|nr:hypothetical protein [Terriglobales bacterium]
FDLASPSQRGGSLATPAHKFPVHPSQHKATGATLGAKSLDENPAIIHLRKLQAKKMQLSLIGAID